MNTLLLLSLSLLCCTITSAVPLKKMPDPNDIRYYLSAESLEPLQNSYMKISYDLSKVRFFLWTPENGPENHYEFREDATPQDLLDNNFRPERPTKFISHGWNSEGVDFTMPFVKAYFSHHDHDYNIIGIDYSPLATWDNYFAAANNAIRVGTYAGEKLGVNLLINGLGHTPSQIHAIGHSLGGHLVGHFGRAIKEIAQLGQIGRVTSLDPAKPWFDVTAHTNRVHRDDAEFVDVIHTNSGFLLYGRLSLPDELGDIDFYPNGGQHQPGCNDMCLGYICLEVNLFDLFKSSCSHSRSHQYYVESIIAAPVAEKFVSTACENWDNFQNGNCPVETTPAPMGEMLSKDRVIRENKANGKTAFFLTTNEQPPFSTNSGIN